MADAPIAPHDRPNDAPWSGRDPAEGRLIAIFFDPPMAIARVGRSPEPLEAYRWEVDENPHRGVMTRVAPAPSLRPVPIHDTGHPPERLEVYTPETVRFKDDHGRVKPVAPFFELWARVQFADGEIVAMPVTEPLLRAQGGGLETLEFTVNAANRKAEARTGVASCAAVAHVVFTADDYRRHRLDAISPHTEDQVPMVRPDAPLPLGRIQTFVAGTQGQHPEYRLDQVRLRFTPGSGDAYGPPEAAEAVASPRQPGDFEPAVLEYGRIHRMTRPENRIFSSDTPWLGYSWRHDDTPKWPTPMDSYDGSRVGPGHSWGLIDDTCDLIIEARLAASGRLFETKARAFAGPPDFAPDKRPMYSIRDELEDRDLPPAELDLDTTPNAILDLFRRIFETASLVNLDQRRAWALAGNASILGAHSATDPDWDAGVTPHVGPKSMREADKPYADLTPDYTPGQGDTLVPVSGPADRLPYTQVVQQVHARMADSPVLQAYLARRPDRVRDLIRPPFAPIKHLPRRVGMTKPAAVPVGKWRVMGPVPQEPTPFLTPRNEPLRYRDPRDMMDQTYDMRMPPFMRHSMGVPLTITRRQYDLLMAYLDKLEADPAWRDPLHPMSDEEGAPA